MRSREVYRSIVDGPRGGGSPFKLVLDDGTLAGPFGLMVRFPHFGAPLQDLGSAIRFEGALTPRAREIAILTVARLSGSVFETTAHQAVGRAAGLSERELERLADGTFDSPDPLESAVAALVTELEAGVDAVTVPEGLDEPIVAEVVVLAGYYRMIAQLMRRFGTDVPAQPAE